MRPSNADLQFLTMDELEAVIRAIPDEVVDPFVGDYRVPYPLFDLDRITTLHATLDRRFKFGEDVSRVQVAQATYFLREAELWVAQSRAE